MSPYRSIRRRILVLCLGVLGIAGVPVTWANEALVRQNVESRFSVKVDAVSRTPYGLYEVRLGDEIVYTDDKVSFLLVGSLIDSRTRQNVTEERKARLSAVRFDELPLEAAVKTVRGDGRRVLAVFADPNCPFCTRFEREMASLTDVTIYTFLYPILDRNNGGDSTRKSKAVWCARDRAKAWDDLMVKGIRPTVTLDCANPLEANLELGRRLGVSGTPTTFTSDGQRIVGARFAAVQKALEESAKKN